jgi:O-antigen/teichoic acid export membrane protein
MFSRLLKSPRWQSIIKTAGGVALFRVVAMACSFLQLPLAIGALGKDRFGLWTTIAASVALLNFSDLGIGNGLQSKLGIYFGEKNVDRCIDVIYSSVLLLAVLAIIVAIVSIALIHTLIDPSRVLGISADIYGAEAKSAIQAALVCFAIAMPVSAMGRISFALQKGWFVSVAQALAAVISLGWCFWLSKSTPNVADFIYVQNIPGFCLTVFSAVYVLKSLKLKPRLKSFLNFKEARSTVSLGVAYILPQISNMAITSMQPILITRYVGLGEAGLYNVLVRFFNALMLPQGIIMGSLAPAYSHAFGAGDITWLKTTYNRSLSITFAIGVGAITCGFISIKLGVINLLGAGNLEAPSNSLILALGSWTCLSLMGATVACLLNAIGKPHGQAIYGTCFALLAVLFMRLSVPQIGIIGVPLSLLLSYLMAVVPFAFRQANGYLKA